MASTEPRIRRDIKADQEAERNAQTLGLPGRLYLRKEGTSYVSITLDLPAKADHIRAELQPVIATLVQGFALRYWRTSKRSSTASGASVAPDYVSLEVKPEDADHFVVALAAVLETPKGSVPLVASPTRTAQLP